MTTVTCPAGHESSTDDYCDTCGAPIGAARVDDHPVVVTQMHDDGLAKARTEERYLELVGGWDVDRTR